jgi:hypothetical protein
LSVREKQLRKISDETVDKLYTLFDIGSGRGGAQKGKKFGWSRLQSYSNNKSIHRAIKKVEFKKRIITHKPVAVSFFRLETDPTAFTYTYHPELSFLCIDVDLKTDVPTNKIESVRDKIFDAIEFLHDKLDSYGIVPGLTHSGSKGYHLFIFLDQPIDAAYLPGFFSEIMKGCPHFEESSTGSKWNLYDKSGKTVYSEIDSLFKTGDGGIIKIPFSQHQSKDGYFELPISIEEIRDYKPVKNPTKGLVKRAAKIFDAWTPVPSSLITENFSTITHFIPTPRHRSKSWAIAGELNLPKKDRASKRIMEEIRSWADPRHPNYTPCMAKAYEWSKPPKRSRYNLRSVLVRIITARLEDWYDMPHADAKSYAAMFIRDYINDEEDNLHPDQLAYQTNYWCDNFVGVVTNCNNLQEDGRPYKCCDSPCGRGSVLDRYISKDIFKLDLPPVTTDTLEEVLNKARLRRSNLQIFKGTRAGGTTTIVANTLEHDEKIGVIVPTTRIADTIQEAMRLAKNGDLKIGILMPRNTEGCLKARMRVIDAQDDFHERSALEMLPFVFRYNCNKCAYCDNFMDIEPGVVKTTSNVSNVQCLYVSNMREIRESNIDVLVLTNKKLHNLILAARAADDNEHIVEAVDAYLILDWLNCADVILLDEISMMIDQPDLDIPLYCTPAEVAEDEENTFDLITKVEDELQQLEFFRNDALVAEMQTLVGNLTEEFMRYRDETGISLYEREITTVEADTLAKYLKRIQAYATRTNIALQWLFKSILVAKEGKWVVLQEPDLTKKENIKIYTLPKFTAGVSEFLAASKARVIAMDATHPLSAARHLDQLIGRHFHRINIGDPHGSADLQKIVPWPTQMKVPQLVSTDPIVQKWVSKEIKDALDLADELFGFDNIVIAVPNKIAAAKIWEMYKGRHLEIMWHRGAESVGVRNERRIMVGICAPFAPKKSHNWIKDVVHPKILSDVSHDALWKYDRNKTEFQTLSRVKDPNFYGDGVRSVYIAVGQTIHEVDYMCSTNVCPPGIIPVSTAKTASGHAVPSMLAAKAWLDRGEVLTKEEQWVVRFIWGGERNVRKIERTLGVSAPKASRIGELINFIKKIQK